MIKGLINDIISYIEYLRRQNLDITIHEKQPYIFDYMYGLSKYNIHDNPLCVSVKSADDAWTHCIECQKKIYDKLKHGPFWGMCYAGVEEYVFPFYLNDEIIGFISVGGYGIDRKSAFLRIEKVSDEYIEDEKLLKQIYDEGLKHEKPDFEYVKSLVMPLSHMLSYFSEHIPKSIITGNSKNLLYSRIVGYINRNFCNVITIDDIANHCNCSASTVSHTFKKYSGYSVGAYINSLRMNKAKVLLLSGIFSIKDISEMAGFSDSNYFTNCFRKYYGISPLKYRKTQ